MSRVFLVLACLFSASCGFTAKSRPGWPSPNEEELFKVCWKEDLPYALIPSACDNPDYIKWDHSPITVSSEPSLSELSISAVDAWNTQLGFELFTWERLNPDADVIITRGGKHWGYRGLAQHIKDGTGRLRCSIKIYDGALYSVDTMVHELGHAAGLEHDPENIRSVMYPTVMGRVLPNIEIADLQVLRHRYRHLARSTS